MPFNAMSLKKKIALSFLISAAIIALLAVFEYLSFVEIRKEIRYLEITDTVSRKSLQLRRHEKNYFLYSPLKASEESLAVYAYLEELKDILARNPDIDRADRLSLRMRISEYEQRFSKIESSAMSLMLLFEKTKAGDKHYAQFFALIESTFLEQPLLSAEFLQKAFRLPPGHKLIAGLYELDADITALRKTGEDILVISKDLDKLAREKVETVIRVSQTAILIFFPLFFIVGIGMLVLGVGYHLAFMIELRRLREDMQRNGLIHGESHFPVSLTLIVAVALFVIGLLAISSMACNVDPFGQR